jgi:hypothetical protein
MSVLRTQHSEKRVGKGDARHDNFTIYHANFPELNKDKPFQGKLFLKKNNRTVVKYK